MKRLLVILLSSVFASHGAAWVAKAEAPFPRALEATAISVERLDSILDDALLVGNGEINALVFSAGGGLELMLTKNDVWDARLDSKLNPVLPKLAWIKRATAQSKTPAEGRDTILETGWGQQARDSYQAHPYPCPRPCAKLVLTKQPLRAFWQQIRREGTRNAWEFRGGAGVMTIQGRAEASNGYAFGPLRIAPGLFAGLIDSSPAWHGDYHTNYNIQQTFWSAYLTNHADLAEPYDRLVRDYFPRARWLAREIFSMEGAYYPHVLFAYEPPDPAKCKSPGGRQYIHHVWGFTLGVAGFTVQPVWWHYQYEPDRKFLEETAYPAVRDVAVWQADFVDQCKGDGPVVLAPSVSPEHWGWTPNFERNRNSAFDIAMFRYVFEAAIEGATTLGRDGKLVARWKQALQRLPPYPTTKGEPRIVVDVEGAPPITYNIAVPAVPVFPGDVVTWWSPPAEKALFARTIDGLKWNGNNSAIILAVARARLSMPGTADWVRQELLARLRPNGTLTLNVLGSSFNDFGHYTEQFGASMAVSELLLQGAGGVIRVFPAWPANQDAESRDLRSQGGFLVSAERKGGRTVMLAVTSTVGGRLRLLSPWPKVVVAGGNHSPQPLVPDGRGVVQVETRPGQRLVFSGSPAASNVR